MPPDLAAWLQEAANQHGPQPASAISGRDEREHLCAGADPGRAVERPPNSPGLFAGSAETLAKLRAAIESNKIAGYEPAAPYRSLAPAVAPGSGGTGE